MEIAWSVVAILVPLLIGAGLSMIGLSPPEFLIARWCFWLSATILGGMELFWQVQTERSGIMRIGVGVLIWVTILVGLPELLRWTKNREALYSISKFESNARTSNALPTTVSEQPGAVVLPRDLSAPQYGSVSLYVGIELQPGYTTRSPSTGQVVKIDPDRKQYLLLITNKTISTFEAIDLRLQFPYPIDESEILSQRDADGVRFDPDMAITVQNIGSGNGSVTFQRKPITSSYQLRIDKLQPKGEAQILFVLNSWRDPRGKTIPPSEAARYMVPDGDPQMIYINGHFKYRIGDEMVAHEYYAPIILSDDKVIHLGKAQPAPKTLVISHNMQ